MVSGGGTKVGFWVSFVWVLSWIGLLGWLVGLIGWLLLERQDSGSPNFEELELFH